MIKLIVQYQLKKLADNKIIEMKERVKNYKNIVNSELNIKLI